MEVFNVINGLTEEQVEIAKFWDCNPYVTHHKGHSMFATKKITPGGHWIGITSIATRKAKSSFADTINAYANVSIALFDAFISCWDEKWRTLVVRPETLINEHYDEEWLPLLQTPPFPEYTSGHSVISRAAAVTLTKIYGDNFSFVDTTEIAYGLPERSYKSFIHASEEAAISRLYGGIHYMMAITEGVSQGQKVGSYIASRLKTKKTSDRLLTLNTTTGEKSLSFLADNYYELWFFFGLQFSFGLQQSNMSAIYRYLGAEESELPVLWLAGPVTGLVVQPIIGAISDGTWSPRFGEENLSF